MKDTIPAAALNQHIAILGKTGAGKSYFARGIVERLLDENKRVCIIDPKGDWFGLRLGASGKSAGYPVVIFGGAHGDLPINAAAGGQIAELVATGNRPTILDLSELTIGERTRLFMDFAAGLFRHNKGPLWLVIDEVHNFAHQGRIQDVDSGKMLHWANRLASEGRGKGIQIIMASQRPQKVHKDTLTCAETLVAMRVVHNLDRAAIKEWMDGAGDKEKSAAVLQSLASLPRGEAWSWSPELGFFGQVKAAKIKTYDSMSPAAIDSQPLKGWADVNLDEVRTKLADVVKEAEANDPKLLRAKIADLSNQLYKSAKGVQAGPAIIEKTVAAAVAARDREWQQAIKERDGIIGNLKGRIGKAVALLHVNGDADPKTAAPPRQTTTGETLGSGSVTAPSRAPKPAGVLTNALTPSLKSPVAAAVRKPASSACADGSGDLQKGARKILQAIAQYPDGCSSEQITVLTGYRATSRYEYLRQLKSLGCVQGDDPFVATADGIAALGADFEPLPTGAALREYWLHRLSGGERKIFNVLIEAHPESVTHSDLQAATNYKGTSIYEYSRQLVARRLIVKESGALRASDNLF